MSEPITNRRSSRHRPSVSPSTPPPPRAHAMPSASQIAAAATSSASAGMQYSTLDIMGNSDSELSDLTESEAGVEQGEEEEEVGGEGVTVPLPRHDAAEVRGKGEPTTTTSGERVGIKRRNRTIHSSGDESDGRGQTSDQGTHTHVKKRGSKQPQTREARDAPSTSSSTFVGESAKGPPTKKPKVHLKTAERDGSLPTDGPIEAEHERESERGATGNRRERINTQGDTRGSSPLGEPSKRKSAPPSQDAPGHTLQQASRRSKQDRRDDEAYEDGSDHGPRRAKEGSLREGDAHRIKGARTREEVEGERRTGKKTSKDELGADESRRDEERPRKRKPAADGDRGKEVQHKERRRAGVDSDGDDVKEVTPSSQDLPKKKKRPLADDTPDASDNQKKHPPAAADRPPLKREGSEMEIQPSPGESSRLGQKRPGQAKSGNRIAELSGHGQGARTPATNSRPRTPNNGHESGPSRRGPVSGGQVKKPYDPLACALSSLAGIAPPETGSGASTPINRKPLLKSEMVPAAELTEAREQAQKKRQELYAKQVRLNSMSHGLLIREYEERPKPWLRRAGIPRDDVTGKYAEATVQAIINLRDQGYFGENVDTWPAM